MHLQYDQWTDSGGCWSNRPYAQYQHVQNGSTHHHRYVLRQNNATWFFRCLFSDSMFCQTFGWEIIACLLFYFVWLHVPDLLLSFRVPIHFLPNLWKKYYHRYDRHGDVCWWVHAPHLTDHAPQRHPAIQCLTRVCRAPVCRVSRGQALCHRSAGAHS